MPNSSPVCAGVLLTWLAVMSSAQSVAAPRITEFLAANETGLRDEDGEYTDWIEIHNPDATAVSLGGYALTDNPANLDQWIFPNVTLEPGGYLVVLASGKDRRDPAGPLHTDFRLGADGEYLALVAPDGQTVVHALAPTFPPQFDDESFGLSPADSSWTYFTSPTPGAPNIGGRRAGPVVRATPENPPQPVPGPLVIHATTRALNDPVLSVKLYYRHMFSPEVMVEMTQVSNEVWSATIPESAVRAGEMLRWRFVATDSKGTETREPAYRSTTDSHQYFGTVPQDPGIQSKLPVLHWFTSNPNGAGTSTGSRGAVYYDGEFYDNVHFSIHGQSTSGFPKKSYNIDFNRTQRFRWSTNAPRVADIDLLTNWADKSKVRHVLAYEIMREAGVPAHFAFTVRVEQNGNFFSTADIVEDADETYLERAGLNPEGALYKVYSNQLNRDAGDNANLGVEKKTRKFENNADLQALINGLDLTGAALTNYFFDNIDIPRCVNMLAANSVIRNIDMHRKNWYIYRDTGRSGEWAILPWDLDLSHGRVWNTENTYFDNNLYTTGYIITGDSIRLVQRLFANPATRAMIMRRIRTLSDRFLQPPPAPGTPENTLYYERRLNELSALIDPVDITPSDARRDFEKWGSWLQGGSVVPYTSSNPAVETMAEAIQRWKSEYLPGRRSYVYNTQVAPRGELPQPQTGVGSDISVPLVVAGAPVKALVPANGDLGISWTGLPSQEPYDTTTWMSGANGVGYERGSGYEGLIGLNVNEAMRNNNSVYVRLEFNVENPTAFQGLELHMKFDDGFAAYLNGVFLVATNAPASRQWNSAATALHEANPSAFVIFDLASKRTALRQGRNVLAIHGLNDSTGSSDMLILPELYATMPGPSTGEQPVISFGRIEASPSSGNQDEEYIELINTNSIAVDISNWRLTGAIEHTFIPGTVLPRNGSLFVTPNAAAFRARTVSPKGGEGRFVQGGYIGHLSSFGETIVLLDDSGATNNTAAYEAEPSDAQRYLVISEVMYHPPGDGLAEYIEILNISSSVTVSLDNVRFTEGIDFNFSTGAVRSLGPDERVLVVRDLAAFTAQYGTNLPIAGTFANDSALNNAGESIKLEDALNGTIREFIYDDSSPWPEEADGSGRSLVLIAPESNPDHTIASNWRASSRLGGTPGRGEDGQPPADPAADLNHNGEPDLIDYALGNDLGLAPIWPVVRTDHAGSANLRLIYPVNPAAQARITVFYSTDFLSWEDAGPYLEGISEEPLDDGRALVTLVFKAPLRDQAQVFLRLQASMQE